MSQDISRTIPIDKHFFLNDRDFYNTHKTFLKFRCLNTNSTYLYQLRPSLNYSSVLTRLIFNCGNWKTNFHNSTRCRPLPRISSVYDKNHFLQSRYKRHALEVNPKLSTFYNYLEITEIDYFSFKLNTKFINEIQIIFVLKLDQRASFKYACCGLAISAIISTSDNIIFVKTNYTKLILYKPITIYLLQYLYVVCAYIKLQVLI